LIFFFAPVLFKKNSVSYSRRTSVFFTDESGVNFTGEEQNSTDASEEGRKGQLTVSIWRDLCGDEVKVLRNSPFYPSYPSEKKLIREFSEFQIEDNKTEYGQTIVGFLNPARNGSYRFAIASDDSSELWLSPSENPDEKQLIASVFIEGAASWTKKNELNKYPNQVSSDINLRKGSQYYIEVIHKQGKGVGFVQVFWSNPGVTDVKLISSEYLSLCSDDVVVSPKQDAMNQLLAERLAISQIAWEKYSNFFALPLISEVGYLPQCTYKSSQVVSKDKIDKYNGVYLVYLSNVFPQDDTFMGSKGRVWSWSNRVADGEIVQSVVDKMIAALYRKTAKDFFLKRIYRVTQKSDPVYGDRFSVDAELGLQHSKKSFRLSEHVYQKKGSDKLCFPEGINWNSKAMVYFILPVKDQGRWVYHFINELTVASLLTGDTNFHVVVADFESQDIDMAEAFNTSLFRSRHTIVNMTGKFYKTLALNEAVARVPSEHDILFLYDLHIDVPVDIVGSVRKNTVEGRIAYFPVVGRLDCGSSSTEHRGFWELEGFGLLGIYKSDWTKIGGTNTEKFKYKWGGEDWDLLDRVLNTKLEVERIKYPGLYHHYHSTQKKWN